jgi:hypothetical protein
MNVLMTAVEFTGSCLALGLGLFLAGEAVRGLSRMRRMASAGTRALEALGGGALVTGGIFGALFSVPM